MGIDAERYLIMKNKKPKIVSYNIGGGCISQSITTPKDMQNEFVCPQTINSVTEFMRYLNMFEKQIRALPKNKNLYDARIEEAVPEQIRQKIIKAYKDAGWPYVSCRLGSKTSTFLILALYNPKP